MTRTALLLVIFALPPGISGCGKSDSQPGSSPSGAADDTSQLCPAIENTGLAKQCIVNSRDNTVHVMIDSNDDQAGRNVCADVSNKISQQTARFSGKWTLQVFSPYRSDKPLAACTLY